MEQRLLLSLQSQPLTRGSNSSRSALSSLAVQRVEAEVKVREAYRQLQDEKLKAAAKEDAKERKFCLS